MRHWTQIRAGDCHCDPISTAVVAVFYQQWSTDAYKKSFSHDYKCQGNVNDLVKKTLLHEQELVTFDDESQFCT